MTDMPPEPTPEPVSSQRRRPAAMLIGGAVVVLAVIVGAIVYIALPAKAGKPAGPDAGVVACRQALGWIPSEALSTADADSKSARGKFAVSSYPDLRTAGTAWLDLRLDFRHQMSVDSPHDLVAFGMKLTTAQYAAYAACGKHGVSFPRYEDNRPKASTGAACTDAASQLSSLNSRLFDDQQDPAAVSADLNDAITHLTTDATAEKNQGVAASIATSLTDLHTALTQAQAGTKLAATITARLEQDGGLIGRECDPAPPTDPACADTSEMISKIGLATLGYTANPMALTDTLGEAVITLRLSIPQESDPQVQTDMQRSVADFQHALATIGAGRTIDSTGLTQLRNDAQTIAGDCG